MAVDRVHRDAQQLGPVALELGQLLWYSESWSEQVGLQSSGSKISTAGLPRRSCSDIGLLLASRSVKSGAGVPTAGGSLMAPPSIFGACLYIVAMSSSVSPVLGKARCPAGASVRHVSWSMPCNTDSASFSGESAMLGASSRKRCSSSFRRRADGCPAIGVVPSSCIVPYFGATSPVPPCVESVPRSS